MGKNARAAICHRTRAAFRNTFPPISKTASGLFGSGYFPKRARLFTFLLFFGMPCAAACPKAPYCFPFLPKGIWAQALTERSAKLPARYCTSPSAAIMAALSVQ